MDKTQKPKNAKNSARTNILESLKDISDSSVKATKSDLLEKIPEDFLNQLLGKQDKKYSGEIIPGESLEFQEVFSGQSEENEKLRKQISLERRIREEEKILIEKKTNQLRLQLHAIMQEIAALAQSTQDLGEELEIATMQVPENPGIYHVVFFEKVLEFIKSFRRKIESAAVWLHASNKRAEKKNYWGMFKKHGTKFLLSPDHYIARSAG
jgi:hypothetical protein